MKESKQTQPDLAAVISSRICHDLVSPVGAIVNGVDLIREIGPGGLDSEFGMISQSADRASGLLQFYRLAFGAAAHDAESVARQALMEKADAMIATPRVSLTWPDAGGPPLSRPEARFLSQLLLCARSLTGMNANVQVDLPGDRTFPITITIDGDLSSGAEDRLRLLQDPSAAVELSPRIIEFALAGRSSHDLGVMLDVDRHSVRTVLRAQQMR
jgi:histidine phosphotransferase ChpT